MAFDLLHVGPVDTNDYLTYTSINPNGISGTVTKVYNSSATGGYTGPTPPTGWQIDLSLNLLPSITETYVNFNIVNNTGASYDTFNIPLTTQTPTNISSTFYILKNNTHFDNSFAIIITNSKPIVSVNPSNNNNYVKVTAF